ncbi:MAG: hypothetical protein ACLU71_11730 [Blautia hansenii]
MTLRHIKKGICTATCKALPEYEWSNAKSAIVICQEKTAQENLQHPVMDAVFFAAMHTKKCRLKISGDHSLQRQI